MTKTPRNDKALCVLGTGSSQVLSGEDRKRGRDRRGEAGVLFTLKRGLNLTVGATKSQ